MRTNKNLFAAHKAYTLRLNPDSLQLLFAVWATRKLFAWGVLEADVLDVIHTKRPNGPKVSDSTP